jgi:hypothetical protein
MSGEALLMAGFIVIILAVLLFDLLFVGRHSHVVKPHEALIWTSVLLCPGKFRPPPP